MKSGPKPWTREQWVAGFFNKVQKTESCWNWIGLTNNKGYGIINRHHSHRMTVASRVSWEIHRGPIPEGIFVCHHCDNPLCVNPDHLFLGSQTDNMRDCVKKGRLNVADHRGKQNPFSKLTDSDIRCIRSLANSLTQQAIADRFGIKQCHVSKIVLRQSWNHVS